MNKLIVIGILALFLVAGCAQQQPIKPSEPTAPIEQPEEPAQVCTAMWLCQDENTKAYRTSDCAFEQITHCPAGCENAECKKVIEEPKLEEPKKEETNEEPLAKEKCEVGWTCLDKNRKGYRFSNCVFTQAEVCPGGCKDGECLPAPPKAEEPKEFTLTEGTGTLQKLGWKLCDFSKGQIFEDGVTDQDFKIYLNSISAGYTHFRVESPGSGIWIIERPIVEATRDDCIKQITDANVYNYLRTGQTLCIQTKEKNIALVGGYWDGVPKEDTKLSWKHYTPK